MGRDAVGEGVRSWVIENLGYYVEKLGYDFIGYWELEKSFE